MFALGGCGGFDASLLSFSKGEAANTAGRNAPDAGAGTAGAAGRTNSGGTGAAGTGSSAPVQDAGDRPPAAGSSADDDGGGVDEPMGDAGLPDGGAVADGATPDAGDPPGCVPISVDDYCSELPPLLAAPVIDGELDCGPELLPITPVGWNGTSALPASHDASMAAAYRPDGIYLYVEVHGTSDPHPAGSGIYCGDAVELYVDHDGSVAASGNYAEPGTMQFLIAAPLASAPATIEASRFVEGRSQGAWATAQLRTALRADGYAVEAFITAADLGLSAWSPQTRVGIDIAIDVAAPAGTPNLRCGVLRGQYFLKIGPTVGSCRGEPWCDSRAFCAPALSSIGD